MPATPLCSLLDIKHPIILAAMGSATSASFAAAATNAGCLGSIATLGRPTADILHDLDAIGDLTDGPFAVNHVPQTLDQEAFAKTLALRPKVISFALGDPGDLVDRAHDAGALVMLQVTNVEQAVAAAERGIDVIIAQGGEAGGFGGTISTMVLVPQVVDAVAPLPVVAAGGIFDGRGLAAALMLGAVGVNIGTRFLVSSESPIDPGWLQAIMSARSEDTVKAAILNQVSPLPGTAGFGTVLRSIRTPFLDRWNDDLAAAARDAAAVGAEMSNARREGRFHEVLATAGQSAGAVREVLPVAGIVRQMVDEADAALAAGRLVPRDRA